jgi:hypothetical protein
MASALFSVPDQEPVCPAFSRLEGGECKRLKSMKVTALTKMFEKYFNFSHFSVL